jgi:hypothetical protein
MPDPNRPPPQPSVTSSSIQFLNAPIKTHFSGELRRHMQTLSPYRIKKHIVIFASPYPVRVNFRVMLAPQNVASRNTCTKVLTAVYVLCHLAPKNSFPGRAV